MTSLCIKVLFFVDRGRSRCVSGEHGHGIAARVAEPRYLKTASSTAYFIVLKATLGDTACDERRERAALLLGRCALAAAAAAVPCSAWGQVRLMLIAITT